MVRKMFIAVLIAFVVAMVVGIGVPLALAYMTTGWVFWLLAALWFVFLGVAAAGAVKFRMKLIAVIILVELFASVIPFALGWAP